MKKLFKNILSFADITFQKMDEKEKQKKEMENRQVKKVLKHHLDELGTTTYEEKSVLVIFLMLVSLWFFRSPGFMTGWGDALSDNYKNMDADKDIAISDGTAAVLMTSILFVLPKKVFFNFNDSILIGCKNTNVLIYFFYILFVKMI